jgi:Ca2+/H+ antiporter, TMEM165/GDT1 family
MNPEKVMFGFFIVLALTLNVGFVYGDINNPNHHNLYEFAAVCVVNLIATILKFGDRSQVGAILLATSLVADLQLLVASMIWAVVEHDKTWTIELAMPYIIAMAIGAMVANIISVLLLIIETVTLER